MAIAPVLPAALRGVTIQVYRAKLPGRTDAARRSALLREMGRWKALGCVAVAPHGFTTEMPARLPALVELARQADLACLPIFGVDSDDAAGKGARILAAARTPGVAGIGIDAEGAYEDETNGAEAAHARDLGAPLVAAPEPLVVLHQPWPIPQVHAARYPWLEFAKYCTAWANQDYFNDWTSVYGAARVKVLAPRFADAWARFERATLAPHGAGGIERVRTLQGAGWEDLPYACADLFARHETIVVWCEPFPGPAVLEALRVRQALDRAVGLYDPSPDARVEPSGRRRWAGESAVVRFQRAYNARAAAGRRLAEDGVYGPATARALRGGWAAATVAAVVRALRLAA